MMFGLFGKRRKRNADVDLALAQLRLERERMKTAMLKAAAETPQGFAYAFAAMFPSVAKMHEVLNPGAGERGGDKYEKLFLEIVKANLNRDPAAELGKLLTLLNGVEEIADRFGSREVPESDDRLVQLLNTPAAEKLGEGLGLAASGFIQQMQAQQAQSVQVTTVEAQPASQLQQSQTPTAEQVLQVLEAEEPEAAARWAYGWAQQWPDLARILQTLLQLPESAVPPTLAAYSSDTSWGPVARWLIQHPDWRAEFLAALRDLAASGTQNEVGTPGSNGHGEHVRASMGI